MRVLAAALLFAAGSACAADIQVMISAGYFRVYAELGPAFERVSGHRLVTTRGPSMGDSPEAIPARIARGEAADVVIMDGHAADELVKRGIAAGKVELARSQVGMVVRAGAPKPDIGSVEAFRRAVLAAKSIAYSDSGSGTYLSGTLFAKLGIADQVLPKSRKVRGPPSGEPVAAVVARGEVEIGFQQVSELIHVTGVDFVGPLPQELQPGFSFAGAVTANAREPDAGRALLRFLALPEHAMVLRKAGLAPRDDSRPRSRIQGDIVYPTLGTPFKDYARPGSRLELDSTYPTLPGTTIRDYSRPGARIEGNAVYPTLPGTNLRDYSRPGRIVEGDTVYPTIPGTNIRDYSQPGYPAR